MYGLFGGHRSSMRLIVLPNFALLARTRVRHHLELSSRGILGEKKIELEFKNDKSCFNI